MGSCNKGVVVEKEDVVITGVKDAPSQTSSPKGTNVNMPECTIRDGSGYFVKGLTLHPLSQAIMDQASKKGTASLANSFGFHISQVSTHIFG